MKHEFTLSGIIIVFACAFIGGAFMIPETNTTFSAVGPRVFPILSGVGMLLCGLWLGWQTWQRQAAGFKFSDLDKADWRTLGTTALVFLIYLLIFEPVGYLISTAVFMFVVARVLGSRAWLRDAIASVVTSGIIYYLFNGLLKVGLPKGLLE